MKGKNIAAVSMASIFFLFLTGTGASGIEKNQLISSKDSAPVQQKQQNNVENIKWSTYRIPAGIYGERKSWLSDTTGSSIRYEDDFYGAVNEEWIEEASKYLSSDIPEISNYVYLQAKGQEDVENIFKDLLHNSSKYSYDTTEGKMINLYCNLLNMEERDKQGSQPAKKYTQKIKNVQSIDELTELLSTKEMDIFNNLYKFKIMPYNDPKSNEVYIQPTILGLVNGDDYSSDSKESEKNRQAYIKYIASLLILDGYSEEETVEKVLQLFELESFLAENMMGLKSIEEGTVDYGALNVSFELKDLHSAVPNLQLEKVIKGLGIDKSESKIVIQQKKWLEALNSIYTNENLPLIKNYIEITILQSLGQFMSSDFEKVTNEYVEYLQNSTKNVSRQEEAYSVVYDNFSGKLGRLYAEKYCSAEEKQDIELLAKELIEKYRGKILNCNWISEDTKRNAIKKLDTMTVNIGYPEEYEEYGGVEVKPYSSGSSLVENMVNLSVYQREKEFESLYEPVNKEIFSSTLVPSSVRAEYHFDSNSLVVTAGLLEPDIYDINDSKEKKLATVGFVVAHEISHAFDDLGALYDSQGNYNNWWTTDDYAKFNEKAEGFEDYFNKIECYPGEYINGKLTLGENIADITALSCVIDVLNDVPDADYKEFFECFADGLKYAVSEEDGKLALLYDEHSPYKWRVNSALSQVNEFYETYDIRKDDAMYVEPDERLKIW